LGLGQVPPLPFFAGKVQFKGAISNALSYDRLKDLEPNIDMTLLADWQIAPFITIPFTQWWSEWQEHLFYRSVNLYCIALNNNYQAAENEVQTKPILMTFHNIFYLHFLTITFDRMIAPILQLSAEAASQLIMLCQPTSPTSATALHLSQMLLVGRNTSCPVPRQQLTKRGSLQANL
jgi:hypothetical protein